MRLLTTNITLFLYEVKKQGIIESMGVRVACMACIYVYIGKIEMLVVMMKIGGNFEREGDRKPA